MQEFFTNLFQTVVNTVVGNWNRILMFVVVLVLGYIVVKLVVRIFQRAMNKSKLKGATGNFLTSLVKTGLLILYVIILLSMLGVDTTSLVAIFSVLTLALSLAVQGVISNLASGIMLVVTKPFEEGDYVDVGGTTGTVEKIHITCTKLKTPDNKVVTIPNSTVTAANITNSSTEETRRVDFTFSIGYGDDFEKAKKIITDICSAHELVLKDQPIFVRVAAHGASSIDLVTRVWVNSGDYWTVNFDILEAVKTAFDKEGIEIPFNQLDVHVKKD